MAAAAFARQLLDYLKQMHDQGILDHNYDRLRSMQNEENPQFVDEVLSMFHRDAPEYISRITDLLRPVDVNYVKVKDAAHQLKGCGSIVGGQRLTIDCYQLQNACIERNKHRCLDMFERVKTEFNLLEGLTNIIQMEKDIAFHATRRCRTRRQP
ncbi:histidine-containing phosphotransfer protein 5-like [Hibiscus syriacus]|uniref:histidine-containing phosphotransfer protein 5-like n=1 Tax=Hibiscus syriacus TaxID=106335 RepID=UPI00192235A1|nr:histidine-containing phosphotransfer protein 5-like [Hibiscus syriacus]